MLTMTVCGSQSGVFLPVVIPSFTPNAEGPLSSVTRAIFSPEIPLHYRYAIAPDISDPQHGPLELVNYSLQWMLQTSRKL